MAKNSFLDWDTTAVNNSDIGGINIAEGCPPSNINNAIREMMAQLRDDIDGKVVYAVKVANYTAVANDNNAVHRYTAAATVTLTAAATLGVNWHYTVIADGADVTIDPNGAETIDGAATLIVPNGSAVDIICNGSAFFTNKALSNQQPFATIASAATTDLSTVGSQNVTVTGTTTITAFGTAPAGTFRRLRFSGALTLTYNATSLILPGAVNITTAAGDTLEAVSLGSGNWVVTSYQSALPIFTKQFDSAQQTITSGGGITVAHGFGALPKLIQILLICTTADAGYSIGDVVPVAFNGPANNNNSVGATYDTTNINLRYGTNVSVFTYTHKSTGASTALVNGSWRMIVRAWA
jgi:hypothetical protein